MFILTEHRPVADKFLNDKRVQALARFTYTHIPLLVFREAENL
jgi:hypothetical protein